MAESYLSPGTRSVPSFKAARRQDIIALRTPTTVTAKTDEISFITRPGDTDTANLGFPRSITPKHFELQVVNALW